MPSKCKAGKKKKKHRKKIIIGIPIKKSFPSHVIICSIGEQWNDLMSRSKNWQQTKMEQTNT